MHDPAYMFVNTDGQKETPERGIRVFKLDKIHYVCNEGSISRLCLGKCK